MSREGGPTDGKDSIYRGLTPSEMDKCRDITHKRAELIFRFMFTKRPFVHVPQLGIKAHCATQDQMAKGIGVSYDQARKPVQLLLGHGALQVVTTGKPTNFALVNNSGYWQRQLVTMKRLESRGQCHGTTKKGERCKIGQDDSSTLYISHRTESGEWYCKTHAPDDAVHVEKSNIKWEREVEQSKQRNHASPQQRTTRMRRAGQERRLRLRDTAKQLGITRDKGETSGDYMLRLQELERKGQLVLPEPLPEPVKIQHKELDLDMEAVVEAFDEDGEPTPEPEVVFKTKTLWPETEGVWIDGVQYLPVKREDEESIKRIEKDRDDLMARLNEMEAAIVAYCDGDTTLKELRGVLLDG